MIDILPANVIEILTGYVNRREYMAHIKIIVVTIGVIGAKNATRDQKVIFDDLFFFQLLQ